MPSPTTRRTLRQELRRAVGWALGITVALSGIALAPEAPADSPVPVASAAKPNIIVVMLDDMRYDELRFAPNVRRYVTDRGIDFRNSFAPYPLCCPTRASFLTGKYAHNHRVLYHENPYGFGAFDDSRTLAGRMQEAGYLTGFVGKYLNRYGVQKSKVTGRSSVRYVPAGWTDWMAGLDTTWPADSPYRGNTYDYYAFTQNINGRVVANRGRYSSTLIGEQTRGLISRYSARNKPFFLWVNPVAPHRGGPGEPDDPAPVRDRAGHRQTFPTPARPAWVRGRFDAALPRALGQPRTGPAEADNSDKPRNMRRYPEATAVEKRGLREIARQRAESIYVWDVEFGKIVRRLKQTGEFASTVLVFTSDNGYFNGEHRQRTGKVKPYEPVLRVPMVVAGPGIRHARQYTPITTMDLTATVLDLAGARVLPAMDGTSKVPALVGPDPGWSVPVVTEGLLSGLKRVAGTGVPAGLTSSGLRVGRYKLIRYATGEGELYDLQVDPLELHSKWKVERYRPIRRQLLNLWARYRSCSAAECRVPLPTALRTERSWLAEQDARTHRALRAYYG